MWMMDMAHNGEPGDQWEMEELLKQRFGAQEKREGSNHRQREQGIHDLWPRNLRQSAVISTPKPALTAGNSAPTFAWHV